MPPFSQNYTYSITLLLLSKQLCSFFLKIMQPCFLNLCNYLSLNYCTSYPISSCFLKILFPTISKKCACVADVPELPAGPQCPYWCQSRSGGGPGRGRGCGPTTASAAARHSRYPRRHWPRAGTAGRRRPAVDLSPDSRGPGSGSLQESKHHQLIKQRF